MIVTINYKIIEKWSELFRSFDTALKVRPIFYNYKLKTIKDYKNTSTMNNEIKHPIPPFTETTAKEKIQLAEDAWNSKDPVKISLAYTKDSEWRNRSQFVNGRTEIQEFLKDKWLHELNYKLKKEYWAHTENRIAVRFEYEYQTVSGEWFRAYGNENWEFDANGLMKKRFASINDLKIEEKDRTLF